MPARKDDAGREKKVDFDELVELMEYMRSERGCPWDREQKISSFKEHIKNESNEVTQAIEKKDYANLKEELGDLLWNIIFLAQVAREEGLFDVYDVMGDLRGKIIRRHPHVFGGVKAETPEEVLKVYYEAKGKEGKRR